MPRIKEETLRTRTKARIKRQSELSYKKLSQQATFQLLSINEGNSHNLKCF